MTPDQVFEKRWALTLLDRALLRLRKELATHGRQQHFDALRVFIWGNPGTVSQGEVAAQLGITVNALSVSVHRLRHRFGELVRSEIARTVATPAEIDDELRHLMEVVG